MAFNESVSKCFTLSGGDIDALVAEAGAYLDACPADKQERLRIRLAVEELLLDWQASLGQGARVELDCRRRGLRPSVQVSAKGACHEPHASKDAPLLRKLLADMALEPAIQYMDGTNIATFYLPRRPAGTGVRVLVALLLGVLVGFAFKALLPSDTLLAICSSLISPIFNTVIGLIGMLAGPLIFLSVFCGISTSPSLASFRKVGKFCLAENLFWAFASLVVSFVVAFAIYGMHVSLSQGSSGAMDEVVSLVLGILPSNLITPFSSGNTLQIVVLAVAFGVMTLKLGKVASKLVDVAEAAKVVVSGLIGWVVALMPILVFLTVVQNIFKDTFFSIVGCLLPFVAVVAIALLVSLLRLVLSARAVHRPLPELLGAIAPATLVALTTASSAASLSECFKACKERLGVPSSVADITIPLGTVLTRHVRPAEFVIFASYFAMQEGVDTSLSWFAMFAIAAYLMSFALPPIPGGALTVISALYLQLGLSAEAITVAMALDVVLDFIATAMHVACNQVTSAHIACACVKADDGEDV